MKRLQKIVVLVLLVFANLSLWAQNDNAVIPVKIELNQCKLIDLKGTDYPISVMSPEKVTVIMKLSYYTVLPEMSFSWDIELYNSTGSLILKDGMAPRDLIVEDDSFYLIAGHCNYSLVADLNNPRYFHVVKLGDEEAEKDFLIESDNTSWFDYYINWAYYTSMYRSAYFVRKYKENNTDEEAKDEALKYAKIADDLIEHYPNGFSAQRNKELPTLKQLQKRMKTNSEISSFFNPVTPDESNTGGATTSSNNKPTQNKSTSNNPTANTVSTNLSKGEWRTSMRKIVDNVTEKYSYNDAYKGQKSNGKKDGMGVFYWWNSGSYYFGEWSNGNMNGYGISVRAEGYTINDCPDCVYYVGNWKDDKKSGKGTCYDRYGNLIYYGDFADGRPTGTYPTTESYSSYKFECIKYDYNDSHNRDVYVGETKNGKRHGYGILVWKNGNAWYGRWEDGARNGQGMDLLYDGSIKYGRWDGDEYYSILSQATTSTADGNSWEVSGSSRSYTDIATPLTYLKNQIDDREKCRLGAITEYGKGIVIHGNNGYAYSSIPNSLIEKIKEIRENKNRISSITLTNSGYYCIVYQRNAWYGVVPQKMSEKLHEFNNNQEEIWSVSISENGDFAIVTDKHYYASNDSDFNSMNKAKDKYGSIKDVCDQ